MLYDILMSDDVLLSINNNLNYIIDLIPEVKYMIGFDHKHPHHHLDVWNHTLYALSLSIKDYDIRLCLLLHDIGKPFSYQEGEVRHFKNHPEKSADMAKIILKRLGYDSEYIEMMCFLIRYHDTPISDKMIETNHELCNKLYEIQYCDALAHHPDKLDKRKKYLSDINKKLRK